MSSIRRFICWVLAVAAVVAGIVLAAGSSQAIAGAAYASLPKSTSSMNFVMPPGRDGTAVSAAVPDPCWAHSEGSSCQDDSDMPSKKTKWKRPHWPPKTHHPPDPPRFRPHPIYPIYPIQPIPVPSVCKADVPSLVNLTQDQAQRAVAAVGLSLVSNQTGNNRIVSQAPVAGTRVSCGWIITVTVDLPPPPPPPPPVEIHSPDPPPAVVVPPTVPVSRIELIPSWFWPVIIALLVLSAALLFGLLLLLAARARKGPRWVDAHVRAVAAATPDVGVEVMESRTENFAPPCVVRLEPHADSGVQVLEEVGR